MESLDSQTGENLKDIGRILDELVFRNLQCHHVRRKAGLAEHRDDALRQFLVQEQARTDVERKPEIEPFGAP